MNTAKKQDVSYNDREIRAFLEHGCEFEGKLNFSGVVRLNGRFRGEIESSDTLIIGDTAEIEGTITVGAIIIGGKVIGEVAARHRAEILSTGAIQGTLQAPSLVTHEGAQIMGQINVRHGNKST